MTDVSARPASANRGASEKPGASEKRNASDARRASKRPEGSRGSSGGEGRFLPPPLGEQLVVGFCASLVATLAEAIVCAARAEGRGVSPGDFVVGILQLAAMYLPFGMAAGLVLGLTLHWLRSASWTAPVRARLGSLRRLFAHDPEAFATGTGFLVGTAAFFLVTSRAALHFATRYHDPNLAAWALAAVVVALAVGALVVSAAVASLIRPLALRFRGASAGAVGILALFGVGGAVAVVAVVSPRLFYVLDLVALAWGPGLAVLWLILTVVVRRTVARRGIGPRRVRVAGLVAVGVALLAIVWSGFTYGHSNRVRSVVEQRSIAGQRLARFYLNATDFDRDGHAFAFGGGDCDDSRASVYPGAPDVEGDGIDADCFDGDGSRQVAVRGDGFYGEVPAGLPERPNFLLITIDALRPDHLGCHGYERDTTPRIDAWCEQAVRFENVVAQSSRSIRSVPAMFTGHYPSQIDYGEEYLWPSLEEENRTFAERLSEAGYETSVVMGTDYFVRMNGFFQGFTRVDQLPMYRPPRSMPVDRGLRELAHLEKGDAPWLLWVHLFNVHEEYLWDGEESQFGDEPIDKYDTEVRLADAEVGRLLDGLRERGLEDDTVVVLASDHGEAFGEHGNRGHSFTLYGEELRSVLILDAPGLAPRAVPDRVGLLDVMPTLLNLARLDVPAPVPARSLVPLATGEGSMPPDRLLFSELMPDGLYPFDQKAIHRGDLKLIWWVREGRHQLFDLAEDPGEQRDLSDDRRAQAEEMLGLLRAWVAQTNRSENRHRDVVERNRLPAEPADMTHRLDLRFPGQFTVLGFDLEKTTFEPGDRIPMTFYYRVEGETNENLFFFVNIEGPPGYPVPPHFHAHHYPMNGRYRTHEWKAGEILRDPVEMIIPEDIRHPVTLRITFSVLTESRHRKPFEGDDDGDMIVDLAEVEIR